MKILIPKPNLFIVGAAKCATTSLHSYLQQHPDIYMCPRKEPHYFCKDYHKECDEFHDAPQLFDVRDDSAYMNLFSEWSGETVIGESSTSYLYSKVAAEEIFRFNPDAKIILSLREPVSLLYSWHSHLVKNAEELVGDFGKALSLEDSRKQNWKRISRLAKHPSRVFYSDVVKLDEQVRRYIDIFGAGKVHIVIYDDIAENTELVFKNILDFLSVDTTFRPDFSIRNQNKIPRLMWLNRFRGSELGFRIKNFLYAYLPSGAFKKARKMLVLNTSIKKRKPLDPEVKKLVRAKLFPVIKNLSEITGRDLITLWNYLEK